MPKTPFADLHGLSEKDIIPKITGKITKLLKPQEKDGANGEYTLQLGDILVDGITLGMTLFDQNLEPHYEGKTVTIKSVNKKGMRGIEYGIYKDKEKITISSQALIDIVGEGSSQSPKQTYVERDDHSQTRDELVDKIVSLHYATDRMVRTAYEGLVKDEETLRCYVSSCFIQANMEGALSLNTKTPPTPKAEPAEGTPEETEHGWKDWASMVVPTNPKKPSKFAGEKLVVVPQFQIKEWATALKDKAELTDFQKAVMQAAKDMNLVEDESDDIPY